MVLAVIDLVLPDFTESTTNHTFSKGQTIFLLIISLAIYALFLGMQTVSHTKHFISPFESHQPSKPMRIHIKYPKKNAFYHGSIIVGYLLPTLFLAKQIALPLDTAMVILNLPLTLGGFMVAILVLAPEGVSAIRASMSNHLQRSVNIALGALLATTALTIPIVLAVGLWTGQAVILGLDNSALTLLILSLVTSMVTFVNGRSSLLQGALHLLLFFSYVMLIFD
jgi:Ca2+:H+ antiporter